MSQVVTASRPAVAEASAPAHPPEAPEGTFDLTIGGIRVVAGAGSLARLGELAAALGRGSSNTSTPVARPLLVTDPGLVEAGHAERALDSLRAAGLEPALFDGVRENPTTLEIAACLDAANAHEPDLLIGLGGGSSMDVAKGVNFLLSGGGRMEDYWGDGRARGPMLPSLGVPTTGGTGSEAQRFALVSRASDHRKMACGDHRARFHTVILDPELLATVPASVAGVTGLDAVSHAVESLVSRRANPVSRLYSREAWRLLDRSLERSLRGDLDASDPSALDVLLGSHFSGAAIEASMLGAAHAAANPLTARYGVVHGAAVGLMLPHVVRRNGRDPEVAARYAELLLSLEPDAEPAAVLANRLEELLEAAGAPRRLRDHGISLDSAVLEELAAAAAEEWTGRFNPVPLEAADFVALYEAAR